MKLTTLLPKKLNEESELEYNTEPILDYFYEMRDPVGIVEHINADPHDIANYVKREAMKFASSHGMHLSGMELQHVYSEIVKYMDEQRR